MANVYSELLWGASGGAGTYYSGPVPTGFIWVVKCVTADTHDALAEEAIDGFELNDSVGRPIYAKRAPLRAGPVYTWNGTQTIESEDNLVMTVYNQNWRWRVSGYALTLP